MKQSHVKDGRLPVFKDRLNILMGDMSITEFAKYIGLSRQTTGFYLNGDRIPDVETLCQICTKCNVSADWLLGLAPESAKTADIEVLAICEKTGLSSEAVKNLIGIYTFDNLKLIETIDILLRNETVWHFLAQDEAAYTGENILRFIKDYLFSTVPSGNLMLSEDGTLTPIRYDSSADHAFLNMLPSGYMGEVPAKDLVDRMRLDRIISALKNMRGVIQRSKEEPCNEK